MPDFFCLLWYLFLNLGMNLKETINDLILEMDDDNIYDLYELMDQIKMELLNEFLWKNNLDYTNHVFWSTIPFNLIKNVWENFIKVGYARESTGMNKIERIMIRNTFKISAFTELTGNTSSDPDEDFHEAFDYHIEEYVNEMSYLMGKEKVDPNQLEFDFNNENPDKQHVVKKPKSAYKPNSLSVFFNSIINNIELDEYNEESLTELLYDKLVERFYDYFCEDASIGQAYISDYGLEPLLVLVRELYDTDEPTDKLRIIDKMLNVVHPRSDMAGWFVKGGSAALSALSGENYGDD